jgi:hypothetical protein
MTQDALKKVNKDWSTARKDKGSTPLAPTPDKLELVLGGPKTGQLLAEYFHWQSRHQTQTNKSSDNSAFAIARGWTRSQLLKAFDRDQKHQKERSLSEEQKLYEAVRRNSAVQSFTHFRASVSKYFCDSEKARKVLDSSAGLGDRLSGFLASASVQEIVLIDPRTKAREGYDKQHALVSHCTKLRTYTAPAQTALLELAAKEKGTFDLAITSPPYFDKERYGSGEGDSDGQCWREFDTLDAWLSGFLFVLLDEQAELLRSGGLMVLNLDNVDGKELCQPALDHANKRGDLVFEGTAGLAKTGRCEPLYLWRKRDPPRPTSTAIATTPATAPTSMRTVHCQDAIEWLQSQPDGSLGHIVTGIPDMHELNMDNIDEYKAWCVNAASLCLRKAAPNAYVFFCQTDRKWKRTLVEKGPFIAAAADAANTFLRFKKIVDKGPVGGNMRCEFSEIRCYSKTKGPTNDTDTTRVIPLGEVIYNNGLGYRPARWMVDFLVRHGTEHTTLVDPFCGQGTTLAAANACGLHAIGVDIDKEQCEKAHQLELECHEDTFVISARRPRASAAASDVEMHNPMPPASDVEMRDAIPLALAAARVDDPPSLPGPCSSPPALSAEKGGDSADSGGDGGCTAIALGKIGVWPSQAATAAALDVEIAPVHQKLCKERGACEESEAGIRGEQWHELAIQRAVINAGWHFQKVHIDAQHKRRVDLKQELKTGSYLVIGVTNNRWCKPGKKNAEPLKYPNEPANGPAISSVGWVHSIAIVDGRVHDHERNEPLTHLWLGANNQPNPDKGYMRSIRKVWRVFPCGKPGTGCKGKCGAMHHATSSTIATPTAPTDQGVEQLNAQLERLAFLKEEDSIPHLTEMVKKAELAARNVTTSADPGFAFAFAKKALDAATCAWDKECDRAECEYAEAYEKEDTEPTTLSLEQRFASRRPLRVEPCKP